MILKNISAIISLFFGLLFLISISCRLPVILSIKDGIIPWWHMAICAAGFTGFIACNWIF